MKFIILNRFRSNLDHQERAFRLFAAIEGRVSAEDRLLPYHRDCDAALRVRNNSGRRFGFRSLQTEPEQKAADADSHPAVAGFGDHKA